MTSPSSRQLTGKSQRREFERRESSQFSGYESKRYHSYVASPKRRRTLKLWNEGEKEAPHASTPAQIHGGERSWLFRRTQQTSKPIRLQIMNDPSLRHRPGLSSVAKLVAGDARMASTSLPDYPCVRLADVRRCVLRLSQNRTASLFCTHPVPNSTSV